MEWCVERGMCSSLHEFFTLAIAWHAIVLYSITLNYIFIHCIVFRYTYTLLILHYITMHYYHYITLLYNTNITLHYYALLYITLQYSALLYITLKYSTPPSEARRRPRATRAPPESPPPPPPAPPRGPEARGGVVGAFGLLLRVCCLGFVCC